MQKNYLREIIITVFTAGWFLFVSTNVNTQLGGVYLHFTWISLALLIIGITIFDRKIHITFQKSPGGMLNAILWGLGGWIALLISSVAVLSFVDPAQANIGSVIKLMGATTPALANSKFANWLTFGVAVAFIETQLWARGLEFISDVFGIDISERASKRIFSGFMALIIFLSFVFLLFHLTAKGITNTSSLIIVFIMMMISMIMVAIFQETRQAVFLHIWANTVASYLILFATGLLSI